MLKILIVDDDKKIRIILRRLIQKSFACEIFEAENGLEGLSTMSKHKPDLVFLDVSMPVMNGQETLASIRADENFSNTPVIILSATADRSIVSKLIKDGIKEYILKPIDINQTYERISKIIYSLIENKQTMPVQIEEEPVKNKLLIIDSDENFRSFFADIFKNEYDIIQAPNGMDGLAIILEQKFNLIIISDNLSLMKEKLIAKKIRDNKYQAECKIYLCSEDPDSFTDDENLFNGKIKKSYKEDSFKEDFYSVIPKLDKQITEIDEGKEKSVKTEVESK